MTLKILLALTLITAAATPVHAGYEAPNHIDPCRSADGRFEVSAVQVAHGKNTHGHNAWEFVWRDLEQGTERRFPARGVQGGQVYAQLFVPPGGETFALFNHVTLWWEKNSHMHAHDHLPKKEKAEPAVWQVQPVFDNRLIIYDSQDGSVLNTLSVADFLQPDEWETVLAVFNRVHWCLPYERLDFKATPRTQYAFYRVSPDYAVLEVQPTTARARRREPPRRVQVSLADGRILDGTPAETVRPFVGPDRHPSNSPAWKESYKPSVDPVRQPGTYAIASAAEAFPPDKAPKKLPGFKHGELTLVSGGYTKADTPAWLIKQNGKTAHPSALYFTDLDTGKLYRHVPGTAAEEILAGATRAKAGPDKHLYGSFGGTLARWRPGTEPESLADIPELSLNDIAVSSRGLVYVTTLKDPEKGRLTLVDPETRTATVLFDGEEHPALANPNGIALSKDERFLFVGISNYKARKHSSIYAFPLLPDGTIDLDAGKAAPWIPVKAPDGITTDRAGNLFFTSGNTVHAYTPYGQPWGKIKIPKGSGTNLTFGGKHGKTLYITTRESLFAVDVD